MAVHASSSVLLLSCRGMCAGLDTSPRAASCAPCVASDPCWGPQPWQLLCRAKLCTIWLLVFKSGPPLSPLLPVKLRKHYAIGLG